MKSIFTLDYSNVSNIFLCHDSPSENSTLMRGGHGQKLTDYSDTHVLDFEPNLKTLCLMAVIENNLDQTTYLPKEIR